MEGGRKRKKLQNIEEHDDGDEDEEEKMRLFFALIQSTKATRDRIKSKESAQEEKSKGVWSPKFQPEDFIEDGYEKHKSIITLQLAPASSSTARQNNQKEEEQQEQEEKEDKQRVVEEQKGLDLNLSL